MKMKSHKGLAGPLQVGQWHHATNGDNVYDSLICLLLFTKVDRPPVAIVATIVLT